MSKKVQFYSNLDGDERGSLINRSHLARDWGCLSSFSGPNIPQENIDAKRPLRAIRDDSGLSINDFAAKVEVSPSTLEKIDDGLPVTATTKIKIAKALEIPHKVKKPVQKSEGS